MQQRVSADGQCTRINLSLLVGFGGNFRDTGEREEKYPCGNFFQGGHNDEFLCKNGLSEQTLVIAPGLTSMWLPRVSGLSTISPPGLTNLPHGSDRIELRNQGRLATPLTMQLLQSEYIRSDFTIAQAMSTYQYSFRQLGNVCICNRSAMMDKSNCRVHLPIDGMTDIAYGCVVVSSYLAQDSRNNEHKAKRPALRV